MTESTSYAYYEYLDNTADRISYGENHPERKNFYKVLKENSQIKGYELKRLEELADPVDEKVMPARDAPNEVFSYLGLEDIEPHRGRSTFKSLLGKEILSVSKRLHRGNIIFTGLRPYLNKAHLVEIEEGIGSAELFIIQPNRKIVTPEYLLEYLLSELILTQTKWILTGCSYPRLEYEDFKDLRVILPEIAEQEDLVRGAIRLRRKAETLENRMKYFVEHFRGLIPLKLGIKMPHDYQFDYFTLWSSEGGARLDFTWNRPWLIEVEDLLDRVGASYLGAYLQPKIESGVGKAGTKEGMTPILNIENLKRDGRIHRKGLLYISEAPKQKLLAQGDILISRTRDAGICVIVTEKEKGFTFSQNVIRFRLKDNMCISPEYLVAYLNSWLGQAQIEMWESGSAGKNINTKKIPKFRIKVPQEISLMDEITKEIYQIWKKMEELDIAIESKLSEIRRYFANLFLV